MCVRERRDVFIFFCFNLTFLPQLGGTIGDIEGMPFVEAFRQFQFRCGFSNFANIHVSLVPQVCLLCIYLAVVRCMLCKHTET